MTNSKSSQPQRVFIFGAGSAGESLIDEIKNQSQPKYKIVGLIDDDPDKQGQIVKQYSVLGSRSSLKKLIQQHQVDKVLIAIPSVKGEIFSKILQICVEAGITCQTIPRTKEIIEGKVDWRRLRQLKIEDVIGRPIVKHDVADISSVIQGKVVLVTGAAGSIGSELSRQIIHYLPQQLLLLDWWENGLYQLNLELRRIDNHDCRQIVVGNIQDYQQLDHLFSRYKPELVFHAAAYKHVPLMEHNPAEAIKNNVLGTYNLIKLAKKHLVPRFVFISTDKAVRPKSVMGATKYIGERITLSGANKQQIFSAVRFGNVLDSYGSVLPLFKKQIKTGGPVTITDRRMTRYFMTIPEAAQLILKAASLSQGNEIYILDMGKPIKIEELAKKLILLSGYIPGEEIAFEYIGKRPGEKLVEVLSTPTEQLKRTKDKKIYMIINQRRCSSSLIKRSIGQLRQATTTDSTAHCQQIIMKVVTQLSDS